MSLILLNVWARQGSKVSFEVIASQIRAWSAPNCRMCLARLNSRWKKVETHRQGLDSRFCRHAINNAVDLASLVAVCDAVAWASVWRRVRAFGFEETPCVDILEHLFRDQVS